MFGSTPPDAMVTLPMIVLSSSSFFTARVIWGSGMGWYEAREGDGIARVLIVLMFHDCAPFCESGVYA